MTNRNKITGEVKEPRGHRARLGQRAAQLCRSQPTPDPEQAQAFLSRSSDAPAGLAAAVSCTARPVMAAGILHDGLKQGFSGPTS